MKNKTAVWRLVAAIGVAVFVAACSDGELSLGNNLNITPPAPVVLKFVADPATVEVGGSTTLIWEVEEADSIELASAPEGGFLFHAGPFEDLSGTTQVDGITETTEFILTASKTVMAVVPTQADENAVADEENPAIAAISVEKAGQIPLPGEPPVPSTSPVTSTTQATTVVTVIAAQEECSISITSDAGAAPINAGDSTTVRWTATPDTAQVNVSGSDGSSVAVNATATGTAAVTPNETTTYTAVAVCADGQQKSASVTVTVSQADVEPNIRANGEEDLVTVSNFTNGVNITYTVTPANALAKVAADRDVSCTPALPADFEVLTSGMGSSVCLLTGDTTFTITAKAGNREQTDKVKVVLQGGQMADAKISATPWAFEGETVKITADPDAIEGNNRALIKEVRVAGKVYPLPETGPLVVGTVLVPSGGVDVSVVSVSDIEIKHPKVVQAVTPITMLPTADVEEFSRIILDSANPEMAYVGVKKPGYCQDNGCGHVSAYKSNIKNVSEYSSMDIDIATELLATGDYWKTGDDGVKGKAFFEMVKDYPVSAIAADENRIFVGTTGLLAYSEDDGASWKKITTFLRFYSREHKTCAGEMQAGNGETLGSLGRACDLIAQDNHLIIATDVGTLTLKDVEGFISSGDKSLFVGRPSEGSSLSDPQYLTFGAVANDLEATDDAVYLASGKGLFKTADNGETWEKVNGIDEELFSVAVDKNDGKIYVGTGTGIKSKSLTGDGAWQTKEIAQKVFSLAVDPYQAGVVLAGTSSGLYVTRNKGETWTSVNAGGFEGKAVKTVAIAAQADESNNQVRYSISFGGVGGGVADNVTVTIEPESTDDTGDTTGETTGEPTDDGTTDGTTGDATDGTTSDSGTGDETLPMQAYRYVTTNLLPLLTR